MLVLFLCLPLHAQDGNAYIPPELAGAVVFYEGFDGTTIAHLTDGKTSTSPAPEAAAGIAGKGYAMPAAKTNQQVSVRSPDLHPARGLTLSMWWQPGRDITAADGVNLLGLYGPERRTISTYVADHRPHMRFVEGANACLLVRDFPGVKQMWGLYGPAMFAAGTWHHVALVISNGSRIDIYWDGKLRTSQTVKERRLRADEGGTAVFGRSGWQEFPIVIDELMILDRSLGPAEIERYVTAVRALAARDWPPPEPTKDPE